MPLTFSSTIGSARLVWRGYSSLAALVRRYERHRLPIVYAIVYAIVRVGGGSAKLPIAGQEVEQKKGREQQSSQHLCTLRLHVQILSGGVLTGNAHCAFSGIL